MGEIVSYYDETIKELMLKDGQNLLDIGCGSGRVTRAIKAAYPKAQVTGIDPSGRSLATAMRKARDKGLDISFVNASAERLPFPDGSFDVVFSSMAFHHMPTGVKVLAVREAYRVLRQGGILMLVDVGKPEGLLMKFLIVPLRIFEIRAYLKDNLEGRLPAFMEEAGFKVDEARRPYMGIRFLRGKK